MPMTPIPNPTETAMRAIIYSRVSTDAQERDGTSLDTQERACVDHALDQGWEVVRRIRDTDSGSLLEREGLTELRDALRHGIADVIVAYAVDRLSRSQNHIGLLFDEFEGAGVTMAFVTERFEDTAVGRFILAARAFIAEVEREKIAERTMRGKEERARSGRIPQATGRGMYGYRYDSDTGRRVINSEQAAVVRRVFEDFAGGASILGITNALNEAGTLSFTGRAWSAWTVKNMLRNPGYAGRTIFNRTKTGHRRDPLTGKRRRTVALRDESEWIEIPDATPPVISQELFDAVQTRLLDPERRRQAQRKNDYPLRGVVRCSHCRSAMVGQTSMGKYRYYRCRRAYAGPRHDRCPARYVRAADLERAVARELTTVLASPEVVLAELEHASSDGARDDDLAAAQQLLVSLDNQRQRVLKLFQMGEVDEAYLQKELGAIRVRRSPAEATVARLNGSGSRPRTPANPEEFAATCEVLRGRVMEGIEAGRLKDVAEAMQIAVTIARTDDGASGALEGVIPHEIGRFGEDFSHHCTNMGMTTWV
ncbi:MAG: recombinase family protein [Chloroflexi bacterium]|nr:recombinase family protein [Chloroflexota bacterium]